ncbi:MAG: DNA gyrase subunit A [Deltaproteobacteria bacterium]|nr:DNA gyrase subunit A [Deltaproteobacteria bacterium]
MQTTIEEEIKRSYLNYAMSVIIGRALPDVRDGLKPVHRRILFAMNDLGNVHNKPYKKSARVVGDVIGKYHPHGDQAVYDALVRMAQDFSMRYPIVDGQGNFGSVDGDPPAAMRYTEVRLTRLASEFLDDLGKETVDFFPNYDGSLEEPFVLPTRVPNLLTNGSSGIAVGMATNIPPHNLGELIDGLVALIGDPEISLDELMAHIPAPDFPTAGFIYGSGNLKEAYSSGRGSIKLRARAEVELRAREREAIVISELPYQVNKARLIERIAELVRAKKIEGISDIRDESDREGMRIVLELKKGEEAKVVLNQLYTYSAMQTTFGLNMVAIVDGRPEQLSLKELLNHFISHRREVVTRRSIFELRQAEARAHILEGLKIALDNIDQIVALIRASKTSQEAKEGLISSFELTEAQAQAILDMRLARLTSLEREKIDQEYAELLKTIARLKSLLENENLLMTEIVEELLALKERYADPRRTEIIPTAEEISLEDMIVEEEMVVTVTHSGYIKRTPLSLYRSQRRGGKGTTGAQARQEDFVEQVFTASTHDYVLFFTNQGRVHWLKVYQIPQATRAARGKAVVNLLALGREERLASILPVSQFEEGWFVFIATRNGFVKKTDLMAFSRPRAAGIIGLTLEEGDEVVGVRLTDGRSNIFLVTAQGQSIRFDESQVRSMGRTARGVKGIKLGPGDHVVCLEVIDPHENVATILTVTARGFGKRTNFDKYRLQARGGRGIITIKTTERNGQVVGAARVNDGDQVVLVTDQGKLIRMEAREIRVIGRNTQGVTLFGLGQGARVVGLARVADED